MAENDDTPRAAETVVRRGVGGVAAAIVLGLFCGLLALQVTAVSVAALAAMVVAGVVVLLLWHRLVDRPSGPSLGWAALIGAVAVVAAHVAAAAVVIRTAGTVPDQEAIVAMVFSLWVVAPAVVAAAIGLAAFGRVLAARS